MHPTWGPHHGHPTCRIWPLARQETRSGAHHVPRAVPNRHPSVAVIAHQDLVGGDPVTPGEEISLGSQASAGGMEEQVAEVPAWAPGPYLVPNFHLRASSKPTKGRCQKPFFLHPAPQGQGLHMLGETQGSMFDHRQMHRGSSEVAPGHIPARIPS